MTELPAGEPLLAENQDPWRCATVVRWRIARLIYNLAATVGVLAAHVDVMGSFCFTAPDEAELTALQSLKRWSWAEVEGVVGAAFATNQHLRVL